MNTVNLMEAMNNLDSGILEKAYFGEKRKAKTGTKILLVAALVALLMVTAVAAVETVNWFVDYFQTASENNLSDEQITFIEEITSDLQGSQTCNGYTIAVESAISDGTYGFIKLRLTAPEDVTLGATNYYPENIDTCLIAKEEGKPNSCGAGWGMVEDNDGKENTTGLIVIVRKGLNDRLLWQLKVENLMQTCEKNIGQPDYAQWTELVAEGQWIFDIVFEDGASRELEMIREPILSEVDISLGEKSIYRQVKITSIKLKALSAQITYEYVEPTHGAGDFDPIYVVMKDGSKCFMSPSSGHPGVMTFNFYSPVILDEVDHILLPSGEKLFAPEA